MNVRGQALAPLRRVVVAWIAMCFAISALGLGARHGCSAGSPAQPLSHHHDGGKGSAPPVAQCDCVGHACCHTAAAPPAPGLVVAFVLGSSTSYVAPQSSLPRPGAPHALPYATAPPFLAV
jgi:hypothetical protein